MDRISGLPKVILHDILGRLPDKDAAKTSVLSKAWRETWFSFPILSYCSRNFFNLHGKLDMFIQYVSLQKLKGADIRGIQEVYIDAPNLENLYYRALDMDTPFKMNLDSCTNLRWLSLQNLRSPNKWFLEQFYWIPFLESLMLHNCSMFEHERINIPSPELKFFSLSHCSNLKEVNIDAPNLLSCEYDGKA
ncbi:F-box/LRR-repeat protein At5g02910-like [Arachis duranensis]|uniref:F-box/LRR-repeat protein At5g02910-like n=1 Tax=Arachis duranensis TaxID=130453 RepID=A0A9C6T9X9_ARADU|nr:F-box/LRR-repeat protein At5g02910-like [Arachis duranensis]